MELAQIKTVDGELFSDLILSGVAELKKHIQTVNDLNVFPIPDGDTGDNMYHTIYGGVSGLNKITDNDIGKKATALSDGMLLNARGNSGVILSQLFNGIAKGLEKYSSVSISEFAKAFDEGVKTAYLAVVKPVEGTILTVARESVEYASASVNAEKTLTAFFDDMLTEMKRSLEHTPDLLPVLKEAGVIDSGGAGLYYIIDGMRYAAAGGKQEFPTENSAAIKQDLDFSLFTETSVMTYGYCTEFLLRLQTAKTDVNTFDIQTIIDYLNTIGDSIVAIKTGSVVKVHVHTLTPHKALEFAQKFGEFLTVKIENMTLQHNETVNNAVKEEVAFAKIEKPRKKYGVIAVASGDGLVSMLKELGADEVIDGGQTNNPSSEDFIKGFEKINADHIFVMPNNGNIFLTAKQAAKIYKNSEIRVIETKNIGDCYAALSMADFTADSADEVEKILIDNMQDVATGMVSRAVRDANLNGVNIKNGEYIGFTDKTVYVSSASKTETAKSLAEKMGIAEKPFLITIFGKNVTEEEKNTIRAFSGKFKNLEYYDIDGGQDIYDFIFIVQ